MGKPCTALLFLAAAAMLSVVGCDARQSEGKVIHVGGKVMCQDCSKNWEEWIHGSRPLKGCKVSVTCMDKRDRIVHYGVAKTDEYGAFRLVIERHVVNGKRLDASGCYARLISAPHHDCNVMTDSNSGKTGEKLSSPSLIYRDLIEYTVGPYYFTSPTCDEPDETSKSEYDDDDDLDEE